MASPREDHDEAGAADDVNSSDRPTQRSVQRRRPVVPAAEARERLIIVTIDLLRQLPFNQVTARRVTTEADLALPTIYRIFGSMEGLFAAASHQLMRQALAKTERLQDLELFFDPDVILRSRLLAWLIAEGADPTSFTVSFVDEIIDAFQEETGGVSERAASIWLHSLTFLLEGYALFSGVHNMSEEQVADGFALISELRKLLPTVDATLGWSTEGASPTS